MASSASCECGAEEQTVDHIVVQCPIHRPPHGMHGLTVLDDETIALLLNTWPEIYSAAKQWIKPTRSNDEEDRKNIISSASGRDGIFAMSSRLALRDNVRSSEIRNALNVEW